MSMVCLAVLSFNLTYFRGDFNCNGFVNHHDMRVLLSVFEGPGVVMTRTNRLTGEYVSTGFISLDDDADVDLRDFAIMCDLISSHFRLQSHLSEIRTMMK